MQITNDVFSDLISHAPAPKQPRIASGVNGEEPPYFNAASRRTILDMALYLARYSDLVLLLHGPAGSGKSSLLREMIARGGPNVHAITIAAMPALTPQFLCDTVLNSFKQGAMQPVTGQPTAQIKEQLDLLQRKGYHCIVFIDDADQLTSDVYPLLEMLADLRSDAGRNLLNLVLFAQHHEKIIFPGPTVRHRVKATELQPLAVDEVAAYIQHVQRNLRTDGIAIDFQSRDIKRIARASSGWPGNINTLIEQRSTRAALHPKSSGLLRNFPWASPRYLLGTSSIAAILILVLVFQDSVNNQFEMQPVSSNAATVKPQAPQTPVHVEVIPPPQELAPTLSSPETTSTEIVATASEPIELLPSDPVLEEEVPEERVKLTPAPVTPVHNAAIKPQRDKWLLAQDPDTYTLQVAWSSQESDIRRALKKFSLTDPAAIFSASRKGKPWYGLVTGVYPDFTSATQARAALPEELMRGAWVRRLRSVQSEINRPLGAAESSGQTSESATPASKPSQLP